MNNSIGTIRTFKTEHFTVTVDALEDYDTDLSWDEDGSVREKLEAGEYIAFTARCRVTHDTLGECGVDYLGGCIYSSIDEFQDHRECGKETRRLRAEGSNAVCGSYFHDMIREAIGEARRNIDAAHHIKVRS